MLFISISSWEPEKRDELIKRRAEGLFAPEGAKCLGQWSVAGGGRTFTLFEIDDSMALAQWSASFSDLGKFMTYPVVDTEELIKAYMAK
jgi:muconolactone delta-isomerase